MSSLLSDRAFMRHFDKSKVETKQQMNFLIDGIYAQMLINLREWFRKDNRNDDYELDNVTTNESNLPLIENPLEVNPNDVSDRVITNEANEANCLSTSPSLSNCSLSNLSINDNLEQSAKTQEGNSQSLVVHLHGKDCECADCLPTSPNDDHHELLNQNKEHNEIDDNQTTSQNESQIESSDIRDKYADDYEEEESDEAFQPDDDELDESESDYDDEIPIRKKRARIQNSDQPTGQKKCPQCSKQFSNSDQLQVLLEVHDLNSSESANNNNKSNPFQCDHCGVRFKQQSKLNKHLVVHSNERPFPCDQCEWRFKRKKNLDSHKKTHNKNP